MAANPHEANDRRDGIEQPSNRPGRSLSSKLLLLTILFVLIAEVLIFVPSVANFRMTWLQQRLNTAAAASILITAEQVPELPRKVQDEVLMATGAKAIVLRNAGVSRLLVVSDMPPVVDLRADLGRVMPLVATRDAFDTLLFGGNRTLSITGPMGDNGDEGEIEMILSEAPLRSAMITYSRNIALISFVIALITAALVFLAIRRILIRPIQAMTRSMLRFAADPANQGAIIVPTGRDDELGIAERQLAGMQSQLQSTLRSQKRLADLGLAVSKINHDMRNILASAQLMSDRLIDIEDPAIKRFAPKLIRTIDRAVAYTSDVLAYGKADEKAPSRRRTLLAQVVSDVFDLLGVDQDGSIQLSMAVPADLEVDADPEQLFRVILNLARNAVEAMRADREPSAIKRLSVSAARMGTVVIISVEDTGPGLPRKSRENLFQPFRGSARVGGTGLGLAIAHELVTAHGGTIELREGRTVGTHFEIRLPDAPVNLGSVARPAVRPVLVEDSRNR